MATSAIAFNLDKDEYQVIFAVIVQWNNGMNNQACTCVANQKKYKQQSTSQRWTQQYTIVGGSVWLEDIQADATGSSLVRRRDGCGRHRGGSEYDPAAE